jgi:hypothetical protein
MTHVVVVGTGQSTVVPSGPQFGVKYVLVAPDGSRAVFNDPGDADYVGWLTDVVGLDSPEVRESADDLIGDDGGVHGEFFYGRRPIVLTGNIESRPSNAERNVRMTRLQRASNATRINATLSWAPEGGVEQIVAVRRQQPLRITGGYLKAFQLALVSANPRIYSAEIKQHIYAANDHDDIVANDGSMRTPPIIRVNGPATAIEIHNHTTGEFIVFATAFALTAGQYVDIDFENRTVTKNDGTNQFGQLQFASTTWWELVPGDNEVALHATGTTGATTLVMTWQDAWI